MSGLLLEDRVILDLCGGTGAWSRPYKEAGYNVQVITLPDDVRLFEHTNAYGVLAAPPCTVFANSGARWPRTDDDMRGGLSIVDACIRIISAARPHFWCLENPVGKLRKYLGHPVMLFDPCDYGDPYTKRTCLWGEFNTPKKSPVEPVEGSKMHLNYGGKSERTKEARSITPPGFAKAFFEANP
jgi:hypothetical protein